MANKKNKHCNLNIAHINIRSIVGSMSDIKECILKDRFDIFAVSETWLTHVTRDEVVGIDGFRLVRRDRGLGRGGGILLYVRNSMKFSVLDNIKDDHSEMLCISFTMNGIKNILSVIYRPPGFASVNEFFEEFEYVISRNLLECDNFVCLGDFNIDMLNVDGAHTQRFLSLLHAYNLNQVINEPTRIGRGNATLIDLILCSNTDFLLDSGVDSSFDVSDHLLIKCKLKLDVSRPKPFFKTYRDFKFFDRHLFYNDLFGLPFENILYINDINEKLALFNTLILSLFDVHAPARTARITKKKAPWITQNIKHLMHLRKKALSKYKKNNSLQNWESYRQLRNLVTASIQSEKKMYLNNGLRINNSKNNWKLLRELDVYSKSSPFVPENVGTADDINQYFIGAAGSSLPDQATVDFYLQNRKEGVHVFEFRLATTEEVRSALFSIKTQAIGTDGIGLSMLLLCCPHIIPYIVHLVNVCIETSTFPVLWKSSFLIPIPKVPSPGGLKDLRPISILPTLSKVIERILERQIRDHAERNGIFHSEQSGFRGNHSCATALLKVTDDILAAADRGELTALVLLDYSKAFDKLNHGMLLAILGYLGFGDGACQLIDNYLSGRTQSVKLHGVISDNLSVSAGVPQGSILGPLLFTLYTSQLAAKLKHVSVHYYADDTQVYISFRPEDILEANANLTDDLNVLEGVSLNHCLELNPKKCQALLFGRAQCRIMNQDLLRVSIGNEMLKCSTTARNLGLQLDVNLRFSGHVNHCIKKAFTNLKLIFNQRQLLNTELKRTLCDSLVLSQFNFCDILYGPCLLERDLRRIQLIQNCCVRLVGGIRRYDRGVSAKLREIGWLNMKERRILHGLVLFNKIILNKCPKYLYQKIKFRHDAHNLDLRHKCIITPPSHKTTLFERSFSYQISLHYNKVPMELKLLPHPRFKTAVLKILPQIMV